MYYEFLSYLRDPLKPLYPILFTILALLNAYIVFGDYWLDNLQELLGLFWILATFVVLLVGGGIFDDEYREGTLTQLILYAQPLFIYVLIKLVVVWFFSGFLISLFAFFLASFWLPDIAYILLCTLSMGTFLFLLLSSFTSAITLGHRDVGFLSALLLFPFYIPILIFGTASLRPEYMFATNIPMLFLLIMFVAGITFLPFLTAGALKANLEY